MLYLFEDDERDALSKLFMAPYNYDVLKSFDYKRSNGNLKNVVDHLLEHTDLRLGIYLDLESGNRNTVDIYNHIRIASKRYGSKRIILLPVFGAEYYFIRSIKDKRLIKDESTINQLIELQFYKSSSLAVNNSRALRTFGRYCKLVMSTCFISCFKSKLDHGIDKLSYYIKDCDCSDCGIIKRYQEKYTDFLSECPCIPKGSGIKGKKEITDKDVYEIHKRLVDNYNSVVERFRKIDDPIRSKYNKVTYFPDWS